MASYMFSSFWVDGGYESQGNTDIGWGGRIAVWLWNEIIFLSYIILVLQVMIFCANPPLSQDIHPPLDLWYTLSPLLLGGREIMVVAATRDVSIYSEVSYRGIRGGTKRGEGGCGGGCRGRGGGEIGLGGGGGPRYGIYNM